MNKIFAGFITISRFIALLALILRVPILTANRIGFLIVALIFGITDAVVILGDRKIKENPEEYGADGGGIGAGWWLALIGMTVGTIILSAALLYIFKWTPVIDCSKTQSDHGNGSLLFGFLPFLFIIGPGYLLIMQTILNRANITLPLYFPFNL
tara:strand:+ start:3173 stop:3634 length:462 start_codon:yes stop_codon:yes gene_type:complete